MKSKSRLRTVTGIACALVFACLLMTPGTARSASVEDETLHRLDELRATNPAASPEQMRQNNERMDAAWQFFDTNKPVALPILRRELRAELAKAAPSQMLLLDIGSFLRVQGDAQDGETTTQALLAIDPQAPVIQANFTQLFRFTHDIARSRDGRILDYIDRAFLPTQQTAFIPQHALELHGTLMCASLYGLYGVDGERHLQSKLADPLLTDRSLEVLIWVGSPDSVPAVRKALLERDNYETFTRALAFMMSAGGPAGRAAMLSIDSEQLEPRSRAYYLKVRAPIEAQSYAVLRKNFDRFPGDASIPGEELKKRLAAMYENYGKDDALSPQAILDSTLAKEFLIAELSRLRPRMFHRLSDEALSNVELTNAILNTLRYRDR